MVNAVIVNDSTVLVFYEGRNIVVNDDTVFVIDKSTVNIWFSENHDLLHELEYLFGYLDFLDPEKENRKAVVLDNTYKKITEKTKDKHYSREYFCGHCQSSKKFIGEQTSSDKEELIALITNLTKKYTSVLLVSEDYYTDETFISQLPKRSKVVNLLELKGILSSISNFSDYVNSLFNSSA